ncbi:MAG: hypothetical protein ACJ0RQ_12235 [Candidatus Azotimanducaceae bacterium]
MRIAMLFLGLILLSGCDREYKNCFEAALPKQRALVACNDLWQVCERAARVRAEKECEAFKPKD